MTDRVSKERRTEIMKAVRSENTLPEMTVRRAAHKLGLRYRLHVPNLPGRPDLVFPKWRTAVFVNGCFWHRHPGCKKASTPKTNVEFWQKKFDANVLRDETNYRRLRSMGWKVVVFWQCEIRTPEAARDLLGKYFPPV